MSLLARGYEQAPWAVSGLIEPSRCNHPPQLTWPVVAWDAFINFNLHVELVFGQW